MRRTVPLRYWLLWWTFIGFACRAVVPVGYMPASLGEGGPFVLCHGGFAGSFLQSLTDHESHTGPVDHESHTGQIDHAAHTTQHAHHGDPADGKGEFEAWEICPIGAATGAAAMPGDPQLPLLTLGSENPASVVDSFVLFAWEPVYRSRAPPSARIV